MTTKTKERPILFSAPMVRAILDGRKTQTRRVVKPQPPRKDWLINVKHTGQDVGLFFESGKWRMVGAVGVCRDAMGDQWPKDHAWKCPYGQPGDRLWVRETWFCATGEPGPTLCHYRADDDCDVFRRLWRPSIHMPRWASRITLEITDVRVERLQDISERDACAEGAQCAGFPASLTNRGAFANLWEKINGDGSWDANPWVWVIGFEKVTS